MVKAAVCRTHGAPLALEEVAVAPPGPDQVRVDIEVCAICHSDITYLKGGWGGPTPAIYGHEAAGVVESVGEGVAAIERGQRVLVGLLRTCGACFHCARGEENLCIGSFPGESPFTGQDGEAIAQGLNTGAFAARTVVHRSQVVPVPADVPLESASLLACGVLTGFGAVTNTASVTPGSSVAVIGVGGVGLSAVQGAASLGCEPLIAIDLIDDKLDHAAELGATDLINASRTDVVGAAREVTAAIGPDYVFVTVGVGAAVDQAKAMVRRGGTVVFVGMPPYGLRTEVEVTDLADNAQTYLGSKMGSGRLGRDVPKLLDLYRAGSLELDRMVSNIYPVEEINDAIAQVERGTVVRNLVRFER